MHAKRMKAALLSGFVAVVTGAPAAVYAETLADALVTAYQTSPLLASGKAALRSLDESVPQARAARRPQVDIGASASTATSFDDLGEFLDERNDELEATLNLSLLVFDNGQTKAAVEAARNSVAAGRADLRDIEQFVLFNAVQAYVDVRRDEEFVRLATNDVDRLEETLSATQNRFEVGEVTRTDVSQSQARLAESRSTFAASTGQLEISEEAYRAAVGVPPVNLEPLPPLPETPTSLDAATTLAMQRNPQIISAQFNERAAVYDFDRALAAKGPSVALNGATGVQGQTNLLGEFDDDTFAQIGISGSMPLYTGGRNDSLVRQAQALLDQRRFEVQDAGRTVTQEVAAAWAELDVARASIVARREQAEASRIAAEGVAEEARLGARSTLDLLDADQERLQAEAEVVEAMRNEYVAVYSLLRAMGLLTVEHLGLGIESYDPDINFAQVQDGPRGGYDTSVVDRIRARWER
jgi:outer membrane protein